MILTELETCAILGIRVQAFALVPCPMKPATQLPDFYMATLIRAKPTRSEKIILEFLLNIFRIAQYVSTKGDHV